jgi:hypothetical protein
LPLCVVFADLNLIVPIAGLADAVVLSQVIKLLRVVFVEDFDPADCKSIPHPAVDGSSRKTLHRQQTTTTQLAGPIGCST